LSVIMTTTMGVRRGGRAFAPLRNRN